jgi:RNA polymerase sigma-70 factor (ECF subfamily)
VLFLSGDAALAEDLVSETFVRLWHARERVDLRTVKGYLFAIARNLYLQELRRTRRAAPLDDAIVDPSPGPVERADARAELRAVMTALQRLPEIDRAAVLMRADAQMPYAEIASALGISESSAKVKVHRARLKLAAARSPLAAAVDEQELKR